MLHHKNGIAEIPQMQKRLQQLVIIPLVKSDTRLVQNIGNTDQAGTNLGSKTDTLRLAAGQSAGSPGQGQIIKATLIRKDTLALISFKIGAPIVSCIVVS